MPNTTTPGHITLTVGGQTYSYVVNPNSYSEVDITDFAPRAVSGTPAYSRLGLYLDVAQDGFGHGYGEADFNEPKSYAYSGDFIDTRFKHIQLGTQYTVEQAAVLTIQYLSMAAIGNYEVWATNLGLVVKRASDGTLASAMAATPFREVVSNGRYIFATRSGRMKLVWFGKVASATSTTATLSTFNGAAYTTPFHDIDVWNGGSAYILDGPGFAGDSPITVTDSTTTTITVASWPTAQPTTSSYIMLVKDAGVDGNPPNNFNKLAVFGGSVWASEGVSQNFLHFWSEEDGRDAEGGAGADLGVVQVGPPGHLITNLLAYEHQLYVFCNDGIWAVNEQDTDALAYHQINYATEAHNSNGKVAMVYAGFLVFNIRNKLFKYRSGFQDITPPPLTDFQPYTTFGNFVGGVVKGTHMFIMASSNRAYSGEPTETAGAFTALLCFDGVGWHKLVSFPTPLATSRGLWYSPDNDKMFFGLFQSGSGTLYSIQFQTYSDMPYASFPTSGEHNLYTSYYDFGMRRIPKSYASITLQGEFPTAGQSVVVEYRIDNTSTWTTLGTFTSDLQEINFPANTQGRRIQLRLDLKTTSASLTPIVDAIIIKAMMRPLVLYGISCDITVADNLSDQNRKLIGMTATQIRDTLKAARDSVPPITLVNLHGETVTVYLSSLRFLTRQYEDTDAIETVARCTFVYV